MLGDGPAMPVERGDETAIWTSGSEENRLTETREVANEIGIASEIGNATATGTEIATGIGATAIRTGPVARRQAGLDLHRRATSVLGICHSGWTRRELGMDRETEARHRLDLPPPTHLSTR